MSMRFFLTVFPEKKTPAGAGGFLLSRDWTLRSSPVQKTPGREPAATDTAAADVFGGDLNHELSSFHQSPIYLKSLSLSRAIFAAGPGRVHKTPDL
jgi:hypothetical protein